MKKVRSDGLPPVLRSPESPQEDIRNALMLRAPSIVATGGRLAPLTDSAAPGAHAYTEAPWTLVIGTNRRGRVDIRTRANSAFLAERGHRLDHPVGCLIRGPILVQTRGGGGDHTPTELGHELQTLQEAGAVFRRDGERVWAELELHLPRDGDAIFRDIAIINARQNLLDCESQPPRNLRRHHSRDTIIRGGGGQIVTEFARNELSAIVQLERD